MSTDCADVRDALSARLDGEDPGLAITAIDAHLRGCDACRAWAAAARIPLGPLPSTPDLTPAVLLAVHAPPAATGRRVHNGGRRRGGRPARPVRIAAIAAGVVLVAGTVGAIGARLLRSGSSSGGLLAQVQQVAGSAQSSSRYPGAVVLPVALPKPALTLTDTSGQPFDLAARTAGKVTLVYFGYTHCPDVCPLNMALTADALAKMPASQARQVDVVFVSTDPARDTPPVIRAWLDHFSPTFVGLTGPISAVHAAEHTVEMAASYPATTDGAPVAATGNYSVVHSGYTIVYAQDGSAHLQIDQTVQAAQYATTLEALVTRGFQA